MVDQASASKQSVSGFRADLKNRKIPSRSATSQLDWKFEQFLKLLTTQLKNQDPLNPVKNHEFTSQLVQFASVEQLKKQTGYYEQMLKAQEASTKVASYNLIGRLALSKGSLSQLRNGWAVWEYELPEDVASVQLSIVDREGRVLRRIQGSTSPGAHAAEWDGSTAVQSPEDDYRMKAVAKDKNGQDITGQVDFKINGDHGDESTLKKGSPATWSYEIDPKGQDVASVELHIVDQANKIVARSVGRSSPGKVHNLRWDGMVQGKKAEDGVYSLRVDAQYRRAPGDKKDKTARVGVSGYMPIIKMDSSGDKGTAAILSDNKKVFVKDIEKVR